VNKIVILGKMNHDEFVGLGHYEFKHCLAVSIAILVFLLLVVLSVGKGMPTVEGNVFTIMQINFCSFDILFFLQYGNDKGSDPGLVMWICGGQSGVGQVFSEYFGFPRQSSFHQFFHNHNHLSSGVGTIGQ
jgi:hypothetical protein